MISKMGPVSIDEAKAAVGPGWHPLIDLFYAVVDESVNVAQVKEKFGGLRIYFDLSDDKQQEGTRLGDIVGELEALSRSVCEGCGKLGQTVTLKKVWLKTLCAECRPVYESRVR